MGNHAATRLVPAKELVERIGAGDRQAEEELVKHYWKGLYFILQRRCSDPQLAADMAQDAFIVVIQKARSGAINTPEALSGFIRQTGVNLLIAHFRKEQRRATEAFGEVAIEIEDHKSSVARAVESKQTLALVQQLMDEMKVARDRDVLNSFYINQQSKVEICARLDLTPAHFDRVLFRARARLKQLIEFKLGADYAL